MGVYNIPAPGAVQDIGLIMAGVALIIVAVGVVFLIRYRKTSKRLKGPLGALLTGIILLVTSFVLFSSAGGSTIVIRPGSISVSGAFIGNGTYRASDIKSALVENVYTGALRLSNRDYGTALGDYNEGVYTLSNGAAAHVVSTNQTALVITLNSGLCLVLGTSNTGALASDFAANVAPVVGYRA